MYRLSLSLRFALSAFLFLLTSFFAAAQVVDTAVVVRQVDSLIEVSRELTGKRDFEGALEVNAVAEDIALKRLGRESAAYGSCCFNRGRVLYFKRDFLEAEKWYLESKTIRELAIGKNNPEYAWSLNNLANLYRDMGEYMKAETLFIEAKNIREKVLGKENPDYANSLDNLAVCYLKMGNFIDAEPLFLDAKLIREKILGKEHPDYAWSLNNLANLYQGTGNYETAELLLLESKSVRERTLGKEHPDYAASINNLAALYLRISKFEIAEPLLIEAKSVREKILGKEHPDYATSINNLAVFYKKIGEYEKAELLCVEALTVREKIFGKKHASYISCLINLANIYWELGNYEDAELLMIESINICGNTLGIEHPHYSTCLNNLAGLYMDNNNFDRAEPLYIEAKTIREKILGKEHPNYAITLQGLASLYLRIGNYEKAKQLYLEAKIIFINKFGDKNTDYAWCLNNLGNVYLGEGLYEEAERYYTEAGRIWEDTFGKGHSNLASNLTNLIVLNWTIDNYERVLVLLNELIPLNHEMLLISNNYMSEKELNSYINTFSKIQAFICSYTQVSSTLRSLSVDSRQKMIKLSYNNTLFHKGFLLTASNQIKQLALSDSATTEKFNLLKSYQRRLAAEYAKPISERRHVGELEEKANNMEKDLARSVAGYGEAMRQVKWEEVQQALKPGEAAVEFVHYRYYGKKETDSIMYAALVLRPGDEQPYYVPLCEARQLQAHIEEHRPVSLNNLYAHLGEGMSSLYGLLWSPLEPLLNGVNTIYYSPSGELHRLNLAAVVGPTKELLGDRYHLQLLMSTRQLVSPSPFPKLEGGEAVVFGGIHYDADSTAIHAANDRLGFMAKDTTGGYLSYRDRTRGDFEGTWEYLDSTQVEAVDISRTLEGAGISTTLLQGVEATEEAFKQIGTTGPSPKVLHLATHGYFFPDPEIRNDGKGMRDGETIFKMSEHPLIRSGLILAGANHAWRTGHPFPGSEDGILTAYEVSQMNLSNTELVVLSACETGLGDIKGNEGVYGLQRAFRIAGAKYLLMSLWKVPEGPTRELMTLFYGYWLKEKMPLEDAFRLAQSEMRDKHEDPEMWAGFVLVKG